MRLTIFGASGRTGRRLVEQALHAGYHLTAVVRDPARLPVRHPAVASADAVASTLGPRSYWQASSIISAATASILDAMRAPAPAAWSWSAPGRHRRPRHHPVLPAAGRAAAGAAAPRLRRHGRDGGHDQAQRHRLDDPAPTPAHRRPRTGTWRQARDANLRGGSRISRADLAAAILASLDDPDTVKATVAIAY
jgi:putative NADH-flavin reductase